MFGRNQYISGRKVFHLALLLNAFGEFGLAGEASSILDFRFWILDFGFQRGLDSSILSHVGTKNAFRASNEI